MEPVVLKGNREGIVVQLNAKIDFTEMCNRIEAKLKSADFFLGSKTEVIINCGSVVLTDGQAAELKALFRSLGFGVKRIISEISKDEEVMETKIMLPPEVVDNNQFLAQGPAQIIRKNLRSGQSIFYEGTLIIFGDVNPGAEITATGHILVIGSLRGIAHAGAKGNTQAIVFASRLQPTQLRIANFITRAPDEEVLFPTEPEIARIKNGRVVIEKYSQK
ncbi:MAG: septum site-determining protein MinC [Peptococcaceae bacterium]